MKTLYIVKDFKTKENLFTSEELIAPRIGEALKYKSLSKEWLSRVVDVEYQYTESGQNNFAVRLLVIIYVERFNPDK